MARDVQEWQLSFRLNVKLWSFEVVQRVQYTHHTSDLDAVPVLILKFYAYVRIHFIDVR